MLPTLRQLQYLKLLAEQGSFSRAAEAAHVTQPTLSAGVQELEKILGAPVVDRARAGVILTPIGEEAVSRASDILARAEDLVQAAKSAGQPLSGRFRLGVIPTIAPILLPKALPALRTRFPKLKLFLREDQTHKLIAALKAAALDANHPLVGPDAIAPERLAEAGLILLEDGHCLREHVLANCGIEPPKPNDEGTFTATSLPTLVQMIGSGLGVSFLPAMAVEAGLAEDAPISIRHVATAHPSRQIVVAWRATRQSATSPPAAGPR